MKLEEKDTETVPSQYGDLVAYSEDLITRQISAFGNHTRPEFAFALSALDYEMQLFDLGAHIGTFSIAALAKLSQNANLLAVEGSPVTFELLRQNCEGRGPAPVQLLNAFVGTDVPVKYNENSENSGGSNLVQVETGEDAGISLVSIDQLVERYFEPDYIKIDVEGAEYNALSGSQFVSERKPVLYLEVASMLANFGHSAEMLDGLLRGLGYEFFVNVGDRNARHDIYRVGRISRLHRYLPFFDTLCVPKGSDLHDVFMRSSSDIRVFGLERFAFRAIRKIRKTIGLR